MKKTFDETTKSIKKLSFRKFVLIFLSVFILIVAYSYQDEFRRYQVAKEAVSKIYNGHYDDSNGEREFEEYKLYTIGIIYDN